MGFTPPPKPKPRDMYSALAKPAIGPSNQTLSVHVLHKGTLLMIDGKQVTFDRNYRAFFKTFEPFRQGNRYYALVSRSYTGTSVLDLQSGEIIAEEPVDTWGFCPMEFFVPDWWDVHDGTLMPDSRLWDEDRMAWPQGTFGFVAGCYWGRSGARMLQALDLSRITEGIIARDDRFGEVELAHGVPLQKAITLYPDGKKIELAVSKWFVLETGHALGPYGEEPDDNEDETSVPQTTGH